VLSAGERILCAPLGAQVDFDTAQCRDAGLLTSLAPQVARYDRHLWFQLNQIQGGGSAGQRVRQDPHGKWVCGRRDDGAGIARGTPTPNERGGGF